jgi:hypothetical protein
MVPPAGREDEHHLLNQGSDGAERPSAPIDKCDNGVDALIRCTSHLAWLAYAGHRDTAWFVREIGEQFAFIRLHDIWHPWRFLAQMAGAPPFQFGTAGFRPDLVDDFNPARHYTAFVFIGYYLPLWAAILFLILWEIAGFIRYRGVWSWPDIRNGHIGLRHGKLVRTYGPVVLPALIAAQLAER